MRWLGLALVIVWSIFGLGSMAERAVAETSFSPLQRAEEPAGAYAYGFALTYTPVWETGFGLDATGTYQYDLAEHAYRPCLDASYRVNQALSALGTVCEAVKVQEEVRRYSDRNEGFRRIDAELHAAVTIEHRLRPSHPLDPRWTYGVEYPWAVMTSLSGSLLRDPVVISASGGYSLGLEDRNARLTVHIGAGIVANEAVSLAWLAQYVWPSKLAARPQGRLAFRVIYTRGDTSEFMCDTFVIVQGERPLMGLAIEWTKHPTPRAYD